MPRRFLTAEDVRRSSAAEILVDEGTVVTPQALEAAASSGIAIRTESGAYREPEPDRGPDAQRAAVVIPHLPEPSDELQETGVAITVVGRNRRGVLAEITAALTECSANVHDISQKMVEGYFHLILICELDAGASFNALKERMEGLGGPDDYVVQVMHERVFRFMHRI